VRRDPEIAVLSGQLSRLAATLEAIGAEVSGARARFTWLIVSQFAGLFPEFGGKRFPLLWRGNRDGFYAADFHVRCDTHANTLRVIENTGEHFRRLHVAGVRDAQLEPKY
jgi:hypothetical protein